MMQVRPVKTNLIQRWHTSVVLSGGSINPSLNPRPRWLPLAAAVSVYQMRLQRRRCRARDLADEWPSPSKEDLEDLYALDSPIECIDGKLLGLDEIDWTKPMKLRGLTDDWPICKTGVREFIDHLDVKFRLREMPRLHEFGFAGPSQGQISLAEYFKADSAEKRVIFENDFLRTVPILGRQFSVPKLLQRIHGMPIFSAARKDTGVGMHRHNESWLAQLLGRKAWFLLPENCERPADRAPWEYLKEAPEGLMICIVEPGEVLYVPRGWWHGTWNLDEEILAIGWEADADVEQMTASEAIFAILDDDLDRLRCLEKELKELEVLPMFEAAARSGNLKILKHLWQKYGAASPRDAPSVAIAAARSGQLEILKFLHREIEDGETIFFHRMWWLPPIFPLGTTALHEASSCGHGDCVAWLLDEKADPQLMDGSGCTPLHLAAIHGHAEVIKILLREPSHQHVNSTWPLHQAAFGGHVEAVKVLLEAGDDVNAQDAIQQTPLHYASLRGHSGVLRVLLDAACDVNPPNAYGRIPLHMCLRDFCESEVLVPLASAPPMESDQNFNAIVILLQNGAEVKALDQDGRTPLDYALLGGHRRAAEAIAAEKSDVCSLQLAPNKKKI